MVDIVFFTHFRIIKELKILQMLNTFDYGAFFFKLLIHHVNGIYHQKVGEYNLLTFSSTFSPKDT